MSGAPRLVLLDGFTMLNNRPRQALPLETYPFTIGRARECHLIIDHSSVSRLHAQLEIDHEQVVITDMGSRNGTYVNGRRLQSGEPCRLRAGDRINVGQICTIEFDEPGTTMMMSPIDLPSVGLVLDEDGAQVLINGKRLDPALSPSQFMLLALLVKHEGRIVTREELRDYVWGPEEEVTDQTIDALVSRLRKRLDEADPDYEYVITRRGFGLMFRNRGHVLLENTAPFEEE